MTHALVCTDACGEGNTLVHALVLLKNRSRFLTTQITLTLVTIVYTTSTMRASPALQISSTVAPGTHYIKISK